MTMPAFAAAPSALLAKDLSRWGGSGIAIAGAHLLLVLALLAERRLPELPSDPPAAIIIDLEPVAMSMTESLLPPAPVSKAAEEIEGPVEEPEEEPIEKMVEEPEPVVESLPEEIEPEQPLDKVVEEPEAEQPVVVARVPRARPDIVPRIVEEPPPKPRRQRAQASAPAAQPSPAPKPAAAPTEGARSGRSSVSPERWQTAVFRHLERRKRYPRDAGGASGTVRVRFTIDVNGNITRHSITGSSGNPLLDQAASEMLSRASPVPAPPADIFRPGLSIDVPIRFTAR